MGISSGPRVAVVGATGAVGRVMLDILWERKFPASEVVALASQRSAGQSIEFGDGSLEVRALSEAALEGVDLVLLDTPDEVSLEWAPKAVQAGAVVVDNSAAWRMDSGTPLVVPEVNPEAARSHKGIIASPNCTTIGVVVPLHALHAQFGLAKVIVSSYQATSGAGQAGVAELAAQAGLGQGLLEGASRGGPAPDVPTEAFPVPILFNVVPKVGSVKDDGFTSEEQKMLRETQKIMGLPGLAVTATCVRVPTVVGHGASVYAEFEQNIDMDIAQKSLAGAPGVEMSDLPNPLAAAGKDPCYVGRLRADLFNPRALSFFTVSDNLRKGAALNTVQIAELLA